MDVKDRLILPGQSRQQRRDTARKAAAGGVNVIPVEQVAPILQEIHLRINVAFELLKMMGATDEMIQEAQANITARLQILAGVPEVKKQ